MTILSNLKVIALDTNGVLTNDVYSPSIKSFIESHGGEYTSDIERLVFGSPHAAGGHIMSVICGLPWTAEETIHAYLAEQKKSLESTPAMLSSGVRQLLETLSATGVSVTSYGGSPKSVSFDPYLSDYERFFDSRYPYLNIGAFRPGMKEVARTFGCQFDEIVFVDDLNRVAEISRALGAGFVGFPGAVYQRQQMRDLAVPYIVDSLSGIDEALLLEIDAKLAAGAFWPSASSLAF